MSDYDDERSASASDSAPQDQDDEYASSSSPDRMDQEGSSDCPPNADDESNSNSKPNGCFSCGDEGHLSRDCTNPGRDESTRESEGDSRKSGNYGQTEIMEGEGIGIFDELNKAVFDNSEISFSKYESIPDEIAGENQAQSMEEFDEMDIENMKNRKLAGKRKLEDQESESNGASINNNGDIGDVDASSNSVGSPVGPTTAKKALLEINVRKLLPDLEKHWKPVEDDPNDFQAWTYLLQYVDQENELLAAREAYDAFLSRYPYCYGYWKKYADYEKRKGSAEDCEQVFRRGLAAISLSVDLWIHYLNYCKAAHEQQPEYIRTQYEAATLACGLEFRSDKLWEHYLHWELELNELRNVLVVYDKVISTPTQKYQEHFSSFKEFVQKHAPEDILSSEEYTDIKNEVQSEAPEELEGESLVEKIREKIVERRTTAHKANEGEITARWTFEEAIKRPYFHVKPLEKGQLKMWKEYLEFEIEKGDLARVVVLFERCLIACALYEEYWIRYVKYLHAQHKLGFDVIERLREVFRRACTIHHQNKPWINLHWAAFEESLGNVEKAVEILERLMKTLPESIHAMYRLVNVERRRGNFNRCSEVFENFISQTKNKADGVQITIKYAQFLTKNLGDYEKAKKLLEEAVDKEDSTKPKVVMALVNVALDRQPVDIDLVVSAFDQALQSNIADEQKVTFAHRKIEFLEEYGNDIESIEKAHEELQTIAKSLREKRANPQAEDPTKVPPGAGPEDPSKASANTNGATPGQYGSGANQGAYGQQYNQYGNYANWNYQQPAGYSSGYNQQGWSAYQGYYG